MVTTHTASGERLEGRDNGPGDYVQAKYDEALRSAGGYTARSATSFFSNSGFGKGLLVMALTIVAVAAVGGALAASGGTLAIAGAGGIMTNATIGQGIMFGIGEGIMSLFSLGGAVAMATGGIVGTIVEGHRHPPEMKVEEAKTLAKQYQESREKSVSPALAAAPEKETTQAATAATTETKPEQACEASFVAREMQRRNELAATERKVG
jgi:hypothetical protein